jgi:hypothetical protein
MKEQIQKYARKHIKGECYLKVTLGHRGLWCFLYDWLLHTCQTYSVPAKPIPTYRTVCDHKAVDYDTNSYRCGKLPSIYKQKNRLRHAFREQIIQ